MSGVVGGGGSTSAVSYRLQFDWSNQNGFFVGEGDGSQVGPRPKIDKTLLDHRCAPNAYHHATLERVSSDNQCLVGIGGNTSHEKKGFAEMANKETLRCGCGRCLSHLQGKKLFRGKKLSPGGSRATQ